MHMTAAATCRTSTPRRSAASGLAPIPAALRDQLVRDTQSVQALKQAARRHGDEVLTDYEARMELQYAREHFELGCWLAYYAERVGQADGLQDRIDCVARLLRAGLRDVGYYFYTAFRFGERHFDSCFEMGDADAVVAGLYERAKGDDQLAVGLIGAGIQPVN